ncbi:hypothetical protein [Diaphorobacter nitroreducens]
MTNARPQTIGNELFAKVEALLLLEGEPSAFELRALRVQADKLAEASAVDASIVKSGLAAYEWADGDVAYWINNALKLEKSPTTFLNAAVTCRLINDFAKSIEYTRAACEHGLLGPNLAMHASDSFVMTGCFSEAIAVLKACQHEAVQNSLTGIEKRLRGLISSGFTENDLQKEVLAAAHVARLHKKRIVAIGHGHSIDREDGHIFRAEIKFRGDFSDEMRLEASLAQALCDMPHWNPVKLSVEFSHYVHDELQPH